jgi:hypothetical protein
MFDPSMVPTPDPNPLPAPFWVFKLLLVVTFYLHILAMNFMLGGALLALLARWRQKGNQYGTRIFNDVAKKVPVMMAATISLGIAPLLFVQVLYGQFFYTSSILVAWPWFLVLVLVVCAYYGFYFVSYQGVRRPRVAGRVMLFSTTLVLIIGFIYANNLTLSQVPANWAQKYFSSTSGWNLNLSEPTLVPRYLHFMTAAVAVGGLYLVLIAWTKWKQDQEYARAIFQLGGKAFLYATMAQFVIGFWFLFSLPRALRMVFMGTDPLATALLCFGLVAALVTIFMMSTALRKDNIRLAALGVTGITALVVLAMSVMRELLRMAYLKPYYNPRQFAVQTQWSPFLLFLGFFVAGVFFWFVLLKRYGLFSGTKAAKQ